MDLDFLRLLGKLKTVPRAGWVLRGVHDPESVADHSWRMSVMALFLLQDLPNVSAVRACQIALVHDMAEAEVGDITPFDGITPEDKHQREHDAMENISRMLTQCTTANSASSAQLLELYQEYDKGQTLEAQYVKDIDKLDIETFDQISRNFSINIITLIAFIELFVSLFYIIILQFILFSHY